MTSFIRLFKLKFCDAKVVLDALNNLKHQPRWHNYIINLGQSDKKNSHFLRWYWLYHWNMYFVEFLLPICKRIIWHQNCDNCTNTRWIMTEPLITQRLLLLTWFTLIPAWISNHIIGKMWDEFTYPFQNLNSATVEVWEWISNFIPHFIMDIITYSYWD